MRLMLAKLLTLITGVLILLLATIFAALQNG
jgi:hypothetical protein